MERAEVEAQAQAGYRDDDELHLQPLEARSTRALSPVKESGCISVAERRTDSGIERTPCRPTSRPRWSSEGPVLPILRWCESPEIQWVTGKEREEFVARCHSATRI